MKMKTVFLIQLVILQGTNLIGQGDIPPVKKSEESFYQGTDLMYNEISYYNPSGEKIKEEYFEERLPIQTGNYSRQYDSLGRIIKCQMLRLSGSDTIRLRFMKWYYSNSLDSIKKWIWDPSIRKDTFLGEKIIFLYSINKDTVLRKEINYSNRIPQRIEFLTEEYKVGDFLCKKNVVKNYQHSYSKSTSYFFENGDSTRIEEYYSYNLTDSTQELITRKIYQCVEKNWGQDVTVSTERKELTDKAYYRTKWNSPRDTLTYTYKNNDGFWEEYRIEIFDKKNRIIKKIEITPYKEDVLFYQIFEYRYNKFGAIVFEGEYYHTGTDYNVSQPQFLNQAQLKYEYY